MGEKLVSFDGFIYFRKSNLKKIEEAVEMLDSAEIKQLEDRMEDGNENALWINVTVWVDDAGNEEQMVDEVLLKLKKHFIENTSETMESIDVDNFTIN